MRTILRRASGNTKWEYGLDYSGSNEAERAEIHNIRWRPKQNDNPLSNSGDITNCVGHLFQGVTLDGTIMYLIITVCVTYSYTNKKISSESDI